MNNRTEEVRLLTAQEIEAVTGGMTATFVYGGFTMSIEADANGWEVCTTGGRCVSGTASYC
jgi:hypothetical protein